MILVLDNYDSFVYNLARYLRELGCETRVLRNDAVSIADVAAMAPQAIVISPGPCTPTQAGISVELVRSLSASIPMLGVCLGHQAIGQAFGGKSCERLCPCMASVRSCGTTRLACSPDSTILFPPPATTPFVLSNRRFLPRCACRLVQTMA